MVAVASTHPDSLVSKGKRLTGPEEVFCRLIACEGKNQTTAYRLAWKTSANTARALAVRVMSRPHVLARIDELRAKVIAEGIGNMQERRKHLWDKIRAKAEGKPSHSDQINAIREDAILAGERRQDGSQVNVGVVVSLGDVLGGLGGAKALLGAVTQSPAVAVAESRPVESLEDQPAPDTRPEPQNAPASPVGGLLGLLGASSRPAVAASVQVAEWSDE